MKALIIASSLIVTILSASFVLAQSSGGSYEITKTTIDNGGGTSSGGQFSLTGTIGQPDASPKPSTGGVYSLAGGFWANATVIDLLFEDSFESN